MFCRHQGKGHDCCTQGPCTQAVHWAAMNATNARTMQQIAGHAGLHKPLHRRQRAVRHAQMEAVQCDTSLAGRLSCARRSARQQRRISAPHMGGSCTLRHSSCQLLTLHYRKSICLRPWMPNCCSHCLTRTIYDAHIVIKDTARGTTPPTSAAAFALHACYERAAATRTPMVILLLPATCTVWLKLLGKGMLVM